MAPPLKTEYVVGALRLLGMGWYVATAILLGVLGGRWLDERLGTAPFLLLVGIGLGLTASFWGVYRMLVPLLQGNRKDNP